MKYQWQKEPIPQSERRRLNEKVLALIDSNTASQHGITQEDIYNAYTGDSGLHGLNRSDFENYSDYSKAKKEIENGQFFTPPKLCRLVAESLNPGNDDFIADLTCGMGSLFNCLPAEDNLYGCEIDVKAFKVARYLFPNAKIENKDIRLYKPDILFDYVIGNPPYNLRWWTEDGTVLSQLFYCFKAHSLLKPFGILAVIVPASFLSDTFSDGEKIAEMEKRFRFLGQIGLPDSSFRHVGVASFPTKLQFWQKRNGNDRGDAPYSTALSFHLDEGFQVDHAADAIYNSMVREPQKLLQRYKPQAMLALAKSKELSVEFQYQVHKMLYQIKIHPRMKQDYPRCCEYLYQFYTQVQPDGMDYKDWCKKRITEAKVISYFKRVLRKQNAPPPQDRIRFIKRKYDFAYKGDSPRAQARIAPEQKQPIPIYEAISTDGTDRFPGFERLVRRKQREYMVQNQRFQDMREDPEIAAWLFNLCLYDAENDEDIRLNERQKRDINFMLQKRYGLLQWEQGTGKTLAGIAIGMYRMQKQGFHHTWVVSSAISIRNTWDVALPNFGIPYILIDTPHDLARIRAGQFAIITLNKLCKYKRQIKKWLKQYRKKIQLVFDESDEITNPDSSQTKTVLDCFRRCRAKLLETGTTTRNNIAEFFSQLELLYNNSANMISWSPKLYYYEKGDRATLYEKNNPYFGEPIPAYKRGYSLFSDSHLPEKITVFGVGQRTQDIYNANALNELLDKTVITRTFKEVVGKDIRRIHQVPLRFTPEERAVYEQAMERFYEMRWNYFNSTGNSRKDSSMQLIQQIVLMLRISAAPNTVQEYMGGLPVKIRKVTQMVADWSHEIVAVGVRHKNVLQAYADSFRKAFPERPLFIVTGSTTSLAKRRALRKELKESGNGILLSTQQSLPSSVNFEYVNKIVIPELHYNNARMSQYYMRFVRYNSKDWKDIYFVTYEDSIESNQLQMVMAKEKINLFMKGKEADLNEIYKRFGVDYDLKLMYREQDDEGHFHIRWGKQEIAS